MTWLTSTHQHPVFWIKTTLELIFEGRALALTPGNEMPSDFQKFLVVIKGPTARILSFHVKNCGRAFEGHSYL